ncbi:hypothetical protein Rvan_1868 [Rhodomicrobium vannielii ATCC 17100]|uniref:Uncharacterized protein n=1 Tax=Rhodomicrobium vannielii (strain ATCC 17100 / DSM 162 / LMG 4299 / NCIMB 10020 / ATH 3.1.1) TaxID=648757 RepID=E3I074_RHOVT|nr:hypothetical protein [Rhodomicrobium vannielii]ADP71109.1 hypothetical protein Rvan_1868 [Rhodomicrobium vannielii ATCC 17100]
MENEIRQIASDLVEVIVRLQFLAVRLERAVREAGLSRSGPIGRLEDSL